VSGKTSLTLLTEDRVEGVLSWLGGWSDSHLNLHQIGPSAVGVDSEGLNAVLDAVVDVIDGDIELWHYNEH